MVSSADRLTLMGEFLNSWCHLSGWEEHLLITMRSRFHSVMLDVAKNTMFAKARSTARSNGVFSKIRSAFLKLQRYSWKAACISFAGICERQLAK